MSIEYLGPVAVGLKLFDACEFHGDSYLHRTNTVSAATLRKGTISVWNRRSEWDKEQQLVQAAVSATDEFTLRWNADNTIEAVMQNAGDVLRLKSTETWADTLWRHVVLALDFDHATEADRAKLYVDNVEVTYGTATRPAQGTDFRALFKDNVHVVGRYNPTPGSYFDGVMGDVQFVQGVTLTPSSFGRDVGGTWAWQSYNGPHGTNGIRLQFANPDDLGFNSANPT